MRALDTTAEVDEGASKHPASPRTGGALEVAREMSEMARRLARAGVRARHPELDAGALGLRQQWAHVVGQAS